MPRLSDYDYLQNHEQLRAYRQTDATAFAMLEAGEHWDLFHYYLPHESSSRDDLLAHRGQVSALDPSLPHRAGRAFHKLAKIRALLPEYQEWKADQPRTKNGGEKTMTLFAAVQPELSAERFADIVLRAAREQAERDSRRH